MLDIIYIRYRPFLNMALAVGFLCLPIMGVLAVSSITIIYHLLSILLICYHLLKLRIQNPNMILKSTHCNVVDQKVTYLFIVFTVYSAISILLSPFERHILSTSWFNLLKVIILLLFGFYTIRIIHLYKISGELILSYLPLTIMISFVLIIIECYTGYRITRLLHNKNICDMFTLFNKGVCAISVIVWPIIAYFSIKRSLAYGISLLFLVNISLILMSKHLGTSYTSSISIIFSTMLFLGFLVLKRRKKVVALFGMILMLSIFPLIFSNPIYTSVIKSSIAGLKPSIAHRVCIWEYSMSRYKEHRLYGFGFDSSRFFDTIYGDKCDLGTPYNNLPALSLHPHNISIQILLELGIAGFALFLLLVSSFIISILRTDHGMRSSVTHLDLRNRNILESSMIATIFGFILLPFQSFGIWQTWLITVGLLLIMMFGMLKNAISN